MANIETSRKIKWTIKNVSEDKLKQHNKDNTITSSKFRICVDGTFYEWTMCTFSESKFMKFHLYFDKKYAKVISIHFKVHVGESDRMLSFTLDSSTDITGVGWGWDQLISLKDLEDPAKKYVDESQRLIFNIEITLKKKLKLQQAITPQTAGESYAEFFNDNNWSDAAFTCNDNVKVEVHRIVLIKKSAEFKKIFNGMKQQNQRNRKLTNIDSITLKQVLKYAYTGSADLEDVQMIKKIYQAAVAYDLPELQLQCADAFNNLMSSETVLDIFEVSSDLKLEELAGKCLSYIMRLFHQLKTTQKWRNLSVHLKEKVINRFADNYSDIELETTI